VATHPRFLRQSSGVTIDLHTIIFDSTLPRSRRVTATHHACKRDARAGLTQLLAPSPRLEAVGHVTEHQPPGPSLFPFEMTTGPDRWVPHVLYLIWYDVNDRPKGFIFESRCLLPFLCESAERLCGGFSIPPILTEQISLRRPHLEPPLLQGCRMFVSVGLSHSKSTPSPEVA
jgi:hypothetical protein